jgi:hypothetical protein
VVMLVVRLVEYMVSFPLLLGVWPWWLVSVVMNRCDTGRCRPGACAVSAGYRTR